MGKKKKERETRKKQEIRYVKRVLLISLEILLLLLAVIFLALFARKEKKDIVEEATKEAVVLEEELVVEEIEKEEVTTEVEVETETEPEPEEEMGIYTEDGKTVLAFAGDLSFADGYSNMYFLEGRKNGIADCFDEFLWKEMQEADLFLINNEFTYTTRGTPTEEKTFTFRANPEKAGLLKEMGVDLVSLANNHAYDYGEISLLDSMDTLKEIGVPYGGAGRNIEEAMTPISFRVNDRNISYICATQVEQLDNPDTKGATETSAGVFRCYNDNRIYDVVKKAKDQGDFVICFIHWGQELKEEWNWLQTDQAEKLVEAGADLIVGSHPHILQGVDYVGGVPVIYSLGNFWFNSKTFDTGFLKVTLAEEGIESVQLLPAIQSGCVTTMAGGSEQERILDYIRLHSPNVVIDESGMITEK